MSRVPEADAQDPHGAQGGLAEFGQDVQNVQHDNVWLQGFQQLRTDESRQAGAKGVAALTSSTAGFADGEGDFAGEAIADYVTLYCSQLRDLINEAQVDIPSFFRDSLKNDSQIFAVTMAMIYPRMHDLLALEKEFSRQRAIDEVKALNLPIQFEFERYSDEFMERFLQTLLLGCECCDGVAQV